MEKLGVDFKENEFLEVEESKKIKRVPTVILLN